jgi:hypothetical protein
MEFIKNLNEIMNQIAYGWVDRSGKKHTDLDDFSANYILQSPAELRESKLGVCWDQAELERQILSKNSQEPHVFNIIHYANSINPKHRTHTFVLFDYQNHSYWYEHAWEKQAGLHEFENQTAALTEIRNIFIEKELDNNYDPDYLVIYEYPAPPAHLSSEEFYGHCEQNGRKITL